MGSKCGSAGASLFAVSRNRQHTDDRAGANPPDNPRLLTVAKWHRHCQNPCREALQTPIERGQLMADTGSGIGRSVPRKEDDRYLRGRGEFIADIRLPGMQDLAFVRSPLAHARIRGIHLPDNATGSVFTAADLDVRPMQVVSALPGFKVSDQPILARDKVRHVGEPIAVCVAATRAEAEDLAAAVTVDFDELPAVVDMLDARRPGAPLVHEHWGDNVFLETVVEDDLTAIRASAPIVIRRSFRTARQCMSPLEGRGVVAVWDRRLEQLLVYTATQLPHIVRTGPGGVPRPGRRPRAHRRARYRRRLRLQGHPARRGGRGRLARPPPRPSGALDRGPARAADRQRQLPRAPLRHHRLRRRATAGCWRSTPRRPSMPAPTRPIRSPPAWKRRRSPPSCPAPT